MTMYACFDGDEDIVAEVATEEEWQAFRAWGTSIQPYAKFSEIDYLCSYGVCEALAVLETQLIDALDLAVDARVRRIVHALLDVVGERLNEHSRLVVQDRPL